MYMHVYHFQFCLLYVLEVHVVVCRQLKGKQQKHYYNVYESLSSATDPNLEGTVPDDCSGKTIILCMQTAAGASQVPVALRTGVRVVE